MLPWAGCFGDPKDQINIRSLRSGSKAIYRRIPETMVCETHVYVVVLAVKLRVWNRCSRRKMDPDDVGMEGRRNG